MEMTVLREKIEKLLKARDNNGPEGPEKLLFMWVKQGRVNFREFKELIPYLKDSVFVVHKGGK